MKTYITKNDGFSLLEVTIAVAISGIVVAGSVYFIGSFTKDSNKLTKSVAISLTKGTIAGTFGQVAERAGVSAAFMHLPIKNNSNCSATDPCVRSWSEADKKFSQGNDSFPLSYNTIEFFRDSSGEFTDSPITISSDFQHTSLKTSESFIWDPAKVPGKEYYVTWPLVDENSKAFPLMVSLENVDYFTIDPKWISSSPLVPAEDIIKGLNDTQVFNDPEKAMKDRLYLIFSPTNLRNFFLRTISSAKACKNSDCDNLYKAVMGTPTVDPAIYTDHHYAVLFSPLATNSNLYSFFPKLNYVTSSNSWRGQSDFFYFPTNNFSITQEPATSDDFLPDGNVRLKGLGHFLQSGGGAQALVISPVGFAFFFLIKGEMIKQEKSIEKIQSYQLVLRRYNTISAFNDVVVASDIIGKVYIVRKIGNGSLSIVIEK